MLVTTSWPLRADPPKYLYLIPKPEQYELRVTWPWKAPYYTLQIGYGIFKVTFALSLGPEAFAKATSFLPVDLSALGKWGPIAFSAFSIVSDALTIIPQAIPWNGAVLAMKQSMRKSEFMDKIRATPGLQRIFILKGGEIQTWMGVPQAKISDDTIVVETDQPLPKEFFEGADWKWPKPITISDPQATKVRVRLMADGVATGPVWELSMKDLADEKKLPEEIVKAWREEVRKSDKAVPGWLTRKRKGLLPPPFDRIHLEATIENPAGGEVNLGTVALDGSVRQLLNMGYLPKLLSAVGLTRNRELPLSIKHPRRPATAPRACAADYEWLSLTR